MDTYDYSTVCRHVESETESTNCQIKGTLPSWLHGFVLYNGPGLTKIGSSEYLHAFDSSAILQKFNIENGNISYMSKFVQSETYKKNKKANGITIGEFGTPGPSNKGVFSRLKSMVDSDQLMSDNALLAVVKMGKNYFAVGETPFFLQIDPNSLNVTKRVNMNKAYSLATQCIHVVEDEDGFYYTAGQAISITGPKYAILKFPKDGDITKSKTVATIPCRWRLSPCYIHSVALTKNYLVLIEAPLAVSITELLSDVLTNTPFVEGIRWQTDTVLFHIIDRRTWKPVATRYVSDPFFFLHFANAFEKANHIVVDVSTYKDSSILHSMFISKLREGREKGSPEFRSSFHAALKRFVIPLDAGGVRVQDELVTLPDTRCSARRIKTEIHLKPEDLCDQSFENPVMNKKFSLNGNSFLWGMGMGPNRGNYTQLIKIDLQTKETKIFKEEGLYPAPPIFVASPNDQNEDEGLIVCLSLSGSNERLVTLLILDASTMKEHCRATVEIEAAVPMSLHGNFFEAS